jgi:predicted nucleotidyltransferase
MSHQQNITRIKAVYNALEELADEVIFIGGAAVSLYTDRPSLETRPTDDVDILIELLNYNEYAVIEEKLRKKGFVNDTASGVLCRYIIHGVMVDVMPTSDNVLGFSNRWYPEGFANSGRVIIDNNYSIRIFSAVYFIAAKMEAFKSRGKNDGRTSSDFEDIIFILNYRNAVWDELQAAPQSVKKYLKDSFKKLIDDTYIYEAVSAHLEYNEQQRVDFILAGLTDFVNS